ncbi:MAG TPA: sulfatase-like hydrolase/transferase [Vicinamibacterales bacterium]|nr:sulfatase-like hydrolase/transferase [Vicinamibacterales bacterium]
MESLSTAVKQLRATIARAAAIVALLSLSGTPMHGQDASLRPNIVLIMTDDAGYGDLGSYGAPDIKTPNIDSLAAAGVKMTQFYANGSTCTPTRAALITGRYQQRVTLERPLSHATTPDGRLGLPATGQSLPQLLKNGGYATGLIGKWHLGYLPHFSPTAHGFDTFFGFKAGYIDYYQHTDAAGQPDLFENDTPVRVDGYMTDLITDRAVSFIDAHARRPFFVEVAYSAPHWPYQIPDQPSTARNNSVHILPSDDNPNTRADYVKMMERVDRGVGAILAALDRHRLGPNTLVIFTNDNGGEWLSRNAPLFNRKFTLYEGGIRVPAILRFPGRLPANVTSAQVGITMDLTATILAAAGVPAPAGTRFEGIDLIPVLTARQVTPRTLFWRVNTAGLNQRAVRDGNWKLFVEGPRMMLVDVVNDPAERDDVAATHTAIVRKLQQQLAAWEKDVDAEAKALVR